MNRAPQNAQITGHLPTILSKGEARRRYHTDQILPATAEALASPGFGPYTIPCIDWDLPFSGHSSRLGSISARPRRAVRKTAACLASQSPPRLVISQYTKRRDLMPLGQARIHGCIVVAYL